MGITRDFANIIRSNGDIVISGDLDVNGTQTTINTTTFVVEDKNIELGANATSNSQNDGAGISILLPDASPDEFATLTYGNTADAWSFNKKVGIGTSSPNTTLTLSDGTDEFDFGVTANQLIIKSVTSDGSDDQRIIIDAGNGGLSSTRGAYIALSGNEASIEAGKSIYQMGNVAGSSHVFRKAGGIDAVTIDSDGNVGIGTDSPTAVLHAKNTIDTNAASGTGVFRLQGGVSLYSGYIGFDASTMSIGTNNGTRGLSFAAGGSERMRIDSSGNVGINSLGNTTSTLDLTEPSDTAERAIRIENSSARLYVGVEGAAANRFVGSTADNGFIGTTTAQGLEFGTNNNVRMVIDTSGNIGIGTNSPSEKLHVVDTSNPGSDGTVIIEGRRDGGANVLALRARDASAPTVGLPIGQGPVMRFQGFNGTDFSDMAYISAESAAAFTDGDTPSNLIFGTTSDNTETLTERLRIDANGGIFTGGIGTGRGGIATSHLFHIDGTSKYYFELRQTDTNGNTDILFSDGTSGDYGVVGYEHAIDRMQFYTKSLRRMVIDQNGDVGIGETSPLAKLHVIRTTTDGAQRTIYADGNQLSEISSSGTNYLHNVWIENRNFDINSGVTDSGYRIGLNIEGYHDSNVFEGTLATQKNIWSRVGNNTNGTGTITDLYNMHLETLSGGGLTVTNNWGLYQTGSGTKNYFEGSVGIGTGSPFAKLSVTGASASANDSGIFQITDGTGANTDTKITMGVVSSDYGWIQAVKPGTDVFDLVLNPNGGNVGIGTESPRRKLEVYGAAGANVLQSQDSADSTNFLRMYSDVANGSAINVNTGGIIRFAHSDESFANFVERMTIDSSGGIRAATGSRFLAASTGEATPDYSFTSDGSMGMYRVPGSLCFSTGGTERLRIDADGNVGIGTNDPDAKFQINSDNKAVALFYGDKTGRVFQRQIFNGNTATSETIDILTVNSWQSANTNIFVTVKVMMVSPVDAYGKSLILSAFKDNGGSSGTGTGTTLASFGTPAADPTLAWSGDTLQMTTPAVTFLRYSIDVEYIAYDGATVTLPTSIYIGS